MTVLEQRFLQVVPDYLKSISESLKDIAEYLKKENENQAEKQ